MKPAPPHLAAVPQAWYRVCNARDLRKERVISWTLGSRAIAVYRTADGRVVAMDARCPHLGAHLGRGMVRGDELQCALHHWSCSPAGVCRAPSGSGRLSHTVYATAERYGSIFVFAGPEPRFDVPQLGENRADAPPPRVLAGRPVLVEASWAALAMNAFDIAHMDAIHHRVLREEPEIRLLGSDCLELKYVSRITGAGLSDRVMRWLSNDRVTATIECWGGTMIVVRSRVGTLESRLLLCLTPHGNHVTVVPIVARPRSGWPIAEALALRLGRWLFTSFLERDVVPLAGMDLRIERAIGLPGPGGWCARWLLTLPAFPKPDNRARSSVQPLEAVPLDLSLVPPSARGAKPLG
jgi:nitrite reductase/ring-hydroxylating ferredoxin subunit